MKTKADALNYFLNIIDDATKKGIALSETKNADYRVKFNTFLDTAQKYVANIIKIPASTQITQNFIKPLSQSSFNIEQILPGNEKTLTFTGCKSFYVEVDNIATITTSVNGSVTDTITNTEKKVYTAYKRLTGATTTDTVSITFTSDYPFNIRNIGFFEYAFPSEDDVPKYTPQITYDMPTDFLTFDKIILKSDSDIYRSYVEYGWENYRKVILDYEQTGSFDIHYFKLPADIATDAVETTELEIDNKAFDLVCLQCGVLATAADNTALSSWIRSLFIEKLQNVDQVERTLKRTVQTMVSMG